MIFKMQTGCLIQRGMRSLQDITVFATNNFCRQASAARRKSCLQSLTCSQWTIQKVQYSHFSCSNVLPSRHPGQLLKTSLSNCEAHLSKNKHLSYPMSRSLCMLQGVKDRYAGMWVNLAHPQEQTDIQYMCTEEFHTLLLDSLENWRRDGLACVWLTVPISLSQFISVAWREGFQYHHAEGEVAVLNLWLKPNGESKVPQFATHQVGVSGVVVNEDTRELLVVQDKNRAYKLWKFPGGLSELGEDIAATAEREVFEETGVQAKFQSVLAYRQQHTHPGAFGRSDLYFLCRLKPLTFDLNPCDEEIAACQWMSIQQLRDEVKASSMTQCLVSVVQHGLDHGFQQVDMSSTEMASIHRGLSYKIFHRPL